MNAAISAAVSVVSKALAPVLDGLLENWAACDGLGLNITALKMELLRAQGILHAAQDRDVTNPALMELLYMLRQLANRADDVLDELDYFRIQDKLNTTYDAADNHPGGCIHSLGFNVCHTARAVANKFKLPSCLCDAAATGGDLGDQEDDAKKGCLSVVRTCARQRIAGSGCIPKRASKKPLEDGEAMKFNRVEMSKWMVEIVQQLDPVCAKVKEILDLEPLKPTPASIAGNRPKTTQTIIEPELFGRDAEKKAIVDGITHGKYCTNGLTVLQIVGPGGIGKTAFTQHVYQEVKSYFDVMIWVCVSLSFDANRLAQEIVKKTPEVNGEQKNASEEELIEQRLKQKRFLLVLDDVWSYDEDEWKKLLDPFRKGEARGNMVIVTTRIPEAATMVKTVDYSIYLNGLGSEDFMHLFERYVFGYQEAWSDHPNLLVVGREIVVKLKGFPLAAKTVGRLLRKHLTLDYWTKVLQSKEWESQTSSNDIMPALRLSYDYLPFHLQRCFVFCGLFPEDHEFGSKELVHLWIGLDILDSSDPRISLEDVGVNYLNDLVILGFLKEIEKYDSSHCYVVHDLLHNLAVKVSSSECISISSSNVRYVRSSLSVRHLSIIVDEKDVNDRVAFDDFKRDLSTLHTKLKVGNLQTVMLFGNCHGSFTSTFGDMFAEAKAIRVILLSGASYNYILEDVFRSLPRSVHLRYLRIITALRYQSKLSFISNISRFYHLRILDFQECNVHLGPLRAMGNLVKLRHFLVLGGGLELRQIGQLEELGGLLRIHNIENVEQNEKANEAVLVHRNHLEKLILQWGTYGDNMDYFQEHVLESLKPHSNLQHLHIGGHRGATCPSWLGGNLSVTKLESLHLHNVGWKILPPIGELWFVGELGEEQQNCIPSQSFQNLKRLELVKIPWLRKWIGNSTCHLFSQLEVLIVKCCVELVELPFSRCQSELEANKTLFPRLRELEIIDCPKLLSLPTVPWTRAPCSAKIERAGSGLEQLSYSTNYSSQVTLKIKGNGGQDETFWDVLAFSNMVVLEELYVHKCPPLPLNHLQKLTSVKYLRIRSSSNVLWPADREIDVIYELPVECLVIEECAAREKELAQFLSHFQGLNELIINAQKITRVGVMGEQQQTTRGEDEIAAAAGEGGLLLSSPHLQKLNIWGCPELSLLDTSLQGLRSLRSLKISRCPKLASSYSPLLAHGCLTKLYISGTPKFSGSFQPPRAHDKEPTSCKLQELVIDDFTGLLSVPICSLLSSSITRLTLYRIHEVERFTKKQEDALQLLTSLQVLDFNYCDKLQCLPAELHRLSSLKTLEIWNCQAFQSLPNDGLPASLQRLVICDCHAFKLLPNVSLPSYVQDLQISGCPSLESLPNNSLLSSLQHLSISSCEALKLLPKDGLPSSLKSLDIWGCPTLKSLPRLESSLQDLSIHHCPALKSLPKLPISLQKLTIRDCPALKSLPDAGLLNSLCVLNIKGGGNGNSEELMRQCRKLKGIIPIIID